MEGDYTLQICTKRQRFILSNLLATIQYTWATIIKDIFQINIYIDYMLDVMQAHIIICNHNLCWQKYLLLAACKVTATELFPYTNPYSFSLVIVCLHGFLHRNGSRAVCSPAAGIWDGTGINRTN